jgi:hypothetical protein
MNTAIADIVLEEERAEKEAELLADGREITAEDAVKEDDAEA